MKRQTIFYIIGLACIWAILFNYFLNSWLMLPFAYLSNVMYYMIFGIYCKLNYPEYWDRQKNKS